MLKAAADLTRDLDAPVRRIYWADMLGSAVVGYAGLVAAIFAGSTALAIAAGAGRGARALPRGQLHPRADAHQAECRSAASGWSGT